MTGSVSGSNVLAILVVAGMLALAAWVGRQASSTYLVLAGGRLVGWHEESLMRLSAGSEPPLNGNRFSTNLSGISASSGGTATIMGWSRPIGSFRSHEGLRSCL
jgi:hypothetical protein